MVAGANCRTAQMLLTRICAANPSANAAASVRVLALESGQVARSRYWILHPWQVRLSCG